MKRFFLMLALACMLPLCAMAQPATELTFEARNGNAKIDPAILCDGSAATASVFKGGKAASLTITLPKDAEPAIMCFQLKSAPESVILKQKNASGKFEAVATLSNPNAQFVLQLDAAASSTLQVEITGVKKAAVSLQELRIFTQGDLPADVHAYQHGLNSDILYIVPTEDDIDMTQISAWLADGRTVQVMCAVASADEPTLADRLWTAGVDRYPAFGGMEAGKTWNTTALTKALVGAIRASQAPMVLYGGDGAAQEQLASLLPAAIESAKDYNFDMPSAVQHGLCIPSYVYAAASQEAADILAQWTHPGSTALRQYCIDKFADAVHADPATIPYPQRDEDGYLAEGEFVHEDNENGLWAYVSPTLQIKIIRYEQPDIPRRWFVSDIKFKADAETFHQQTYVNATFPGQMIYPETLAQTARLVFGINGDYYIYREDSKATGNIIRNRKVLYNQTKGMGFPNLDTMALHDDGSMTVYDTKSITANELLAMGDVHDALSFGPYLVRDGKLRIWDGKNHDAVEPRNAIGMVEPGHLKVVTVEGRFSKGYGPAGVTLNMLAELMYSQGVEQGFNLDGGNTSVLIFMGEKLNRTAAKSGKGETSSRNMAELFGIGTSDLVHTDQLNGK